MSLLMSWVLYALIATSFFIALFAWAVRAGQFSDQDRARYLPLGLWESGEANMQTTKDTKSTKETKEIGRPDGAPR